MRRIDLDLGAVGDARGGLVGSDHRCQTELACHDRGVAQRSALFHDEAPTTGSNEFTDGPVNAATSTSPGWSWSNASIRSPTTHARPV